MNATSRASRIIGLVLTVLIALFLLFDGAMKLVQPRFVTEATARIGFPVHALMPIGVTLIVATLLYVVPGTAILGAVLLTGYLGGAVATQVHAGSSTFEMLFPAIYGALIWISMLLRESRLRPLLPVHLSGSRAK
jgi:hypothetical protein